MHSQRYVTFPCLWKKNKKTRTALIWQATWGWNVCSKHGGKMQKRGIATEKICVQATVYVFLFTGEIFFSFLTFRRCREASASSPVCCLAKLTNTWNNEIIRKDVLFWFFCRVGGGGVALWWVDVLSDNAVSDFTVNKVHQLIWMYQLYSVVLNWFNTLT